MNKVELGEEEAHIRALEARTRTVSVPRERRSLHDNPLITDRDRCYLQSSGRPQSCERARRLALGLQPRPTLQPNGLVTRLH